MITIIVRLLKWFLVLTLPFLVLIRGAIFFHSEYYFGPWLSVMAGGAVTLIVLIIYMTVIHGMFSSTLGGVRAFKRRSYVALLVIAGYCIQGLFFISSSNVKDSALSSELRELHPIVRLAVSTIIMVDRDLIITDASRQREDYDRMGLPINERSMHYPQEDGYAYAIDLRTNQRSYLHNSLVQNYFRIMGFKTLKHTGTAPHLHVSLKK